MKILIVEDDKALNHGIALSLGNDEIVQAFCIADADRLLDASVDLIILDINLPDGNGLDFCRRIRKTSKTPIIFLTANDMEIDIVSGLESGADDYITKPFSLAVLRARVNAVARRNQENVDLFQFGSFLFDFNNMNFLVDGAQVSLSKRGRIYQGEIRKGRRFYLFGISAQRGHHSDITLDKKFFGGGSAFGKIVIDVFFPGGKAAQRFVFVCGTYVFNIHMCQPV